MEERETWGSSHGRDESNREGKGEVEALVGVVAEHVACDRVMQMLLQSWHTSVTVFACCARRLMPGRTLSTRITSR